MSGAFEESKEGKREAAQATTQPSCYSIYGASPEVDREALKLRYLEGLARVSTIGSTLRYTVLDLVALGIKPRELVAWALEAGYPEQQVRKILSRILLQAGIRRRLSGSGPKVPPEAIAIAKSARAQFGPRATRLLGAAYRFARAQEDSAQPVATLHNLNSAGLIPVRDKANPFL